MAVTIWLLRRHHLTRGRLGFALVTEELADDFIAKGWAQPLNGRDLRAFDYRLPMIGPNDPEPAAEPAKRGRGRPRKVT